MKRGDEGGDDENRGIMGVSFPLVYPVCLERTGLIE